MKNIVLFSFIFFSISLIVSQENKGKLTCIVLDTSTKKPVVYATVMLKKINRGTHADINGKFEIPRKYQQKEIIKISAIGYETKEIKLSSLKNIVENIIYLNKSNSTLDEVIIKSSKKKKKLYPKQIVRRAIENILNNYPTNPHSYIGYYRDYQQPVGNSYQKINNSKTKIEYLNVHEAILESFDNGFTTDKLKNKKNQALLYKFIANKDFLQDSTLTLPYDNKKKKYSESVFITPLGGNELNILDLTNAVRNHDKMSFSFTNVFNKDFIKNHFFKLNKVVYLDDTSLYEISFFSSKDRTSYEYSAYGHIYISKKNYAIYKFNYNLYYRKKENPQYSVTIEYTPKNNKMYLNYISFNNFFEATNGNYFKIDKTTYNSKLNAFKISFNRQIDITTLKPFKRNFKIYYKEKKLKILDVSIFDSNSRTVTVFIDKPSINIINFEKENKNPNYKNYFTFDINNIKDINGFEVNKRPSIKLNQYRELFVQEVFTNKKLPALNNFINKSLPLSKSSVQSKKFKNDYWINSPLKKSKN